MEPETRPPSDVKSQEVKTLSVNLLATSSSEARRLLERFEGTCDSLD
jgi:hypothetical protein